MKPLSHTRKYGRKQRFTLIIVILTGLALLMSARCAYAEESGVWVLTEVRKTLLHEDEHYKYEAAGLNKFEENEASELTANKSTFSSIYKETISKDNEPAAEIVSIGKAEQIPQQIKPGETVRLALTLIGPGDNSGVIRARFKSMSDGSFLPDLDFQANGSAETDKEDFWYNGGHTQYKTFDITTVMTLAGTKPKDSIGLLIESDSGEALYVYEWKTIKEAKTPVLVAVTELPGGDGGDGSGRDDYDGGDGSGRDDYDDDDDDDDKETAAAAEEAVAKALEEVEAAETAEVAETAEAAEEEPLDAETTALLSLLSLLAAAGAGAAGAAGASAGAATGAAGAAGASAGAATETAGASAGMGEQLNFESGDANTDSYLTEISEKLRMLEQQSQSTGLTNSERSEQAILQAIQDGFNSDATDEEYYKSITDANPYIKLNQNGDLIMTDPVTNRQTTYTMGEDGTYDGYSLWEANQQTLHVLRNYDYYSHIEQTERQFESERDERFQEFIDKTKQKQAEERQKYEATLAEQWRQISEDAQREARRIKFAVSRTATDEEFRAELEKRLADDKKWSEHCAARAEFTNKTVEAFEWLKCGVDTTLDIAQGFIPGVKAVNAVYKIASNAALNGAQAYQEGKSVKEIIWEGTKGAAKGTLDAAADNIDGIGKLSKSKNKLVKKVLSNKHIQNGVQFLDKHMKYVKPVADFTAGTASSLIDGKSAVDAVLDGSTNAIINYGTSKLAAKGGDIVESIRIADNQTQTKRNFARRFERELKNVSSKLQKEWKHVKGARPELTRIEKIEKVIEKLFPGSKKFVEEGGGKLANTVAESTIGSSTSNVAKKLLGDATDNATEQAPLMRRNIIKHMLGPEADRLDDKQIEQIFNKTSLLERLAALAKKKRG